MRTATFLLNTPLTPEIVVQLTGQENPSIYLADLVEYINAITSDEKRLFEHIRDHIITEANIGEEQTTFNYTQFQNKLNNACNQLLRAGDKNAAKEMRKLGDQLFFATWNYREIKDAEAAISPHVRQFATTFQQQENSLQKRMRAVATNLQNGLGETASELSSLKSAAFDLWRIGCAALQKNLNKNKPLTYPQIFAFTAVCVCATVAVYNKPIGKLIVPRKAATQQQPIIHPPQSAIAKKFVSNIKPSAPHLSAEQKNQLREIIRLRFYSNILLSLNFDHNISGPYLSKFKDELSEKSSQISKDLTDDLRKKGQVLEARDGLYTIVPYSSKHRGIDQNSLGEFDLTNVTDPLYNQSIYIANQIAKIYKDKKINKTQLLRKIADAADAECLPLLNADPVLGPAKSDFITVLTLKPSP